MMLLSKTWLRILLLAWLVGTMTSISEGKDEPPLNPVSPLRHKTILIDSLFNVGAYDSIMSLIPPLLDDARARGDSIFLSALLIVRGRVELTYRNSAKAGNTLQLACEIAEAARDSSRWMDALGFLGMVMTFQGRHQESITLNQKRLALALKTGNRISEAWARTGLAYVFLMTGELERAREEYTVSADLFRAENLPWAELTPLVGLGRVLDLLDETDAARECYQRVWQTSREIGDMYQESNAVNNLGALEYRYGDMSVAASYFERAYFLNHKMGNLRGTIIPANNIALVKSYLGQYADAASILLEAIRTCEEGGYEDLIGQALCMLGQVRSMQNRMNESANLYRRALALGDMLPIKQRDDAVYGLAKSLNELDSVATAIDLLTSGLEHKPLPDFEQLMGLFLAKCLRRQGRTNEALERAVAAMKSAGDQPRHEAAVLGAFEMSACYEAVGNDEQSYSWYHRGVEALERYRHSTEKHEWREAHGRIRVVVDGGHIVLKFPPDRPQPERIEELFNILQRFKARTLVDRLTEPRRLSESASELTELPLVELEELQSEVLRPEEVFLDFTVGNEMTYLFAVTRDSCRVLTLPGRKSELPTKISFYLETLGHPPATAWNGVGNEVSRDRLSDNDKATMLGENEIDRMGASLFQLLLGQVSDLIAPASRILIAPDSYLSAVPFGALSTSHASGGGLLLETKEIHRVPSATVLKWLRPVPGRKPQHEAVCRLLALVPKGKTELKGVTQEVEALRNNFSGIEIFAGKPPESFFEEGRSACEVIHVAAHVVANNEKPWHSGILLEPPANAPFRLLGERGAGPGDVLPASTTDLDSNRTQLLPTDPYLRAKEIATQRLRARLAVLSGCESALGRTSSGEGVLGLTSAFLSAGVPTIVATLWPVDDAVTADLMKAFYTGLAEGETVASALRNAQIEIKNREKTRHPFYWAGFIVVGDGGVDILIERAGGYSVIFVVAGACVLILLSVFFLRKRYKIHGKNLSAL